MSTQKNAPTPEKVKTLEFARLIIGTGLFVFLISIYVFVEKIPIWLVAVPGFLMGIDIKTLLNIGK